MPYRRNPHPDAPPMRTPGLACDSSTSCRSEGPEAPRAAGSACQIRFDPMNRCVALRRRTRRVGVGPTRSRSAGSIRLQPLMRRSGWLLPLRRAAGLVASVADSEAPCRCPRGTAVRGERRMGGPDLACDPSDICVAASAALLRADAQQRQGPGSSDGRFVTLRVSIGWPSESGRYAADSPRRSHAHAAL